MPAGTSKEENKEKKGSMPPSLLERLRWLILLSTLYRQGPVELYSPPDFILKAFGKKAAYRNLERNLAFRFTVHLVMNLLILFIFFNLFRGKVQNLEITFAIVGFPLISLVQLSAMFFRSIIFSTDTDFYNKYKTTRLRMLIFYPLLVFIWVISSMVYVFLYSVLSIPISTIVSILGLWIFYLLNPAVPSQNILTQLFVTSIAISAAVAGAILPTLQYWAIKRERKKEQQEKNH